SGYGGAARYLAEKFKCKIVCLNLSETENERNRELNKKMNLNEFIEVVDADFAEIPYSQDSFDIVWSEDAILHSPKKEKVFQEVARILKPGGDFIFTDPMQADNVPAGVLQPVLDRIHLQSMGSFSQYTKLANQLNLKKIKIEDLSTHLTRHYTRVKEELIHKKQLLEGHVSESYSEKMLSGLQHWIEAGKKGYLAWGILHFQKPA
ncbi:MAG: methyltransferase domain-containing protein, partial [Leptospiraceae bacterium]|nr:methyltransferase domain-containing protein [Leptospiraceae bacterium]